MSTICTIPNFYDGQTIFVTGGTGFIGKLLIEKLLRSCPEVKRIYMLIRPKRGKDMTERLKAMLEIPVFDLLREQSPTSLEKIVPISGDVTQLRLGLSEEDRQLLIDEVSIVFHSAASVRFDSSLKDAIIQNTRGTQQVVELAKEMKHIIIYAHVSTAYTNIELDRKIVKEKVYRPVVDWREAIRLAETVDHHTLDILTPKYTEPHPNTYTFSKHLSEQLVEDCCEGKIPWVIIRPSIVHSTILEPIPGWTDNFNGAFSFFIAYIKGFSRTQYIPPESRPDVVPADSIVKLILIATWKEATCVDPEEIKQFHVVHGTNNDLYPITLEESFQMCMNIPQESIGAVMWYPDIRVLTNNFYLFYFKLIFYQLLPAIIIDGLLKLSGRKPMLLKLHRRLYLGNMAIRFFVVNKWNFDNKNSVQLDKTLKILPQDEDFILIHPSHINNEKMIINFLENAVIGARKYLLKDNYPSNLKLMRILSIIFNVVWWAVVFWLVHVKFDAFTVCSNKFQNISNYLTEL